MSAKSKTEFLVSVAGVGTYTVNATSAGNAMRKVFAVAIANRQRAIRNGSNSVDGPQMSSRIPPVDPDVGLPTGVFVSAKNERVSVLPPPDERRYIKRKKDPRYARFPK